MQFYNKIEPFYLAIVEFDGVVFDFCKMMSYIKDLSVLIV